VEGKGRPFLLCSRALRGLSGLSGLSAGVRAEAQKLIPRLPEESVPPWAVGGVGLLTGGGRFPRRACHQTWIRATQPTRAAVATLETGNPRRSPCARKERRHEASHSDQAFVDGDVAASLSGMGSA